MKFGLISDIHLAGKPYRLFAQNIAGRLAGSRKCFGRISALYREG